MIIESCHQHTRLTRPAGDLFLVDTVQPAPGTDPQIPETGPNLLTVLAWSCSFRLDHKPAGLHIHSLLIFLISIEWAGSYRAWVVRVRAVEHSRRPPESMVGWASRTAPPWRAAQARQRVAPYDSRCCPRQRRPRRLCRIGTISRSSDGSVSRAWRKHSPHSACQASSAVGGINESGTVQCCANSRQRGQAASGSGIPSTRTQAQTF
jgi:hypothetical protein